MPCRQAFPPLKCRDQQQERPQSHKSINNILYVVVLHPATTASLPSLRCLLLLALVYQIVCEPYAICSSPDKNLECQNKQAAGLVCPNFAITIATAYSREGLCIRYAHSCSFLQRSGLRLPCRHVAPGGKTTCFSGFGRNKLWTGDRVHSE